MKHIHKYANLNEAEEAPIPPASPRKFVSPIGFIIYLRNCWYYGAFPTFHDFACQVYEDFSGMDVDDEFFGEMGLLKGSLWKALDDNGQGGELADADIDNMSLWWGMTPRCAPNILLQHYSPGNPYTATKALDLAFSGTKEIMDKWTNGRDADPGYTGLSIANDPSQIGRYIEEVQTNDNCYFSEEDIIGSINKDSKELQALVKFHKMKKFI